MVAGNLFIGDAMLERHIAHLYDALGRRDFTWTVLAGLEAMDAIPHALGALEDPQPLSRRMVARVAQKTRRLGQRRRTDKLEVHRQNGATLVAQPAVKAAHGLADFGHHLVVNELFAVQ